MSEPEIVEPMPRFRTFKEERDAVISYLITRENSEDWRFEGVRYASEREAIAAVRRAVGLDRPKEGANDV